MKRSIGIGGTRDTLLKRIFKTHRCWILLLLKHVVLEWSKNVESIKLRNSQNIQYPNLFQWSVPPLITRFFWPLPPVGRTWVGSRTAWRLHVAVARWTFWVSQCGTFQAAEPGRGWLKNHPVTKWQNMATP